MNPSLRGCPTDDDVDEEMDEDEDEEDEEEEEEAVALVVAEGLGNRTGEAPEEEEMVVPRPSVMPSFLLLEEDWSRAPCLKGSP